MAFIFLHAMLRLFTDIIIVLSEETEDVSIDWADSTRKHIDLVRLRYL